jgi:hypothetical protein
MLKRLRDELVDVGKIAKGQVPSFLVECLVYEVEDDYFLVDDRYDRLKRIVQRFWQRSGDPGWITGAKEINRVKLLFGPHQPWTAEVVRKFAETAWARLTA